MILKEAISNGRSGKGDSKTHFEKEKEKGQSCRAYHCTSYDVEACSHDNAILLCVDDQR